MNTVPNLQIDKTLDELHALQEFFTSAQEQLREGLITDMGGVDQRIAAVCQIVQNAAPAQQHLYLPELTALIDLLGLYSEELRSLQVAFANQDNTNNSSNGQP